MDWDRILEEAQLVENGTIYFDELTAPFMEIEYEITYNRITGKILRAWPVE